MMFFNQKRPRPRVITSLAEAGRAQPSDTGRHQRACGLQQETRPDLFYQCCENQVCKTLLLGFLPKITHPDLTEMKQQTSKAKLRDILQKTGLSS